MKIGLSYSRCVRDIVDGVVDIGDVLVLITRTNFNPNIDNEWKSIWQGYGGGNGGASSIWSRPEWGAYPAAAEQKFRDVSIELYDSGRMHQPRQFGAHPSRLPHNPHCRLLPPSPQLEEHQLPGRLPKWRHLHPQY